MHQSAGAFSEVSEVLLGILPLDSLNEPLGLRLGQFLFGLFGILKQELDHGLFFAEVIKCGEVGFEDRLDGRAVFQEEVATDDQRIDDVSGEA